MIKYFVKKGMKAKEIHADFQNTLGDSAPSFSTVAKWTSEFKFGRESLDDDPRSGRPKSATTPEFIAKVHKMVMEDRRLKVREIAKAVGMSSEWERYAKQGLVWQGKRSSFIRTTLRRTQVLLPWQNFMN